MLVLILFKVICQYTAGRIHVFSIVKTTENFSWMINKAAISTFKTSSSCIRNQTLNSMASCVAFSLQQKFFGHILESSLFLAKVLDCYLVTRLYNRWIFPVENLALSLSCCKNIYFGKFQDWKRVQSSVFCTYF